MQKSLSQLSENLRSVEARQIELGTSMDELKQLIQNLTQTSFCIKGSIYEVHEHETLSIMRLSVVSATPPHPGHMGDLTFIESNAPAQLARLGVNNWSNDPPRPCPVLKI